MTRYLLPALLLLLTHATQAKTYQVYYLGGQSNIAGYGNNAELNAPYNAPLPEVRMFNGNPAGDFSKGGGRGMWDSLQPGFGRKFKSSGKENIHSAFFGPEVGFGHRIAELYPDQNIAIIKYALGGSALGYGVGNNWYPDYRRGNGINQYDHALTTLRQAFAERDIDGDGEADTLIPAGIIWMQGESDAYDSEIVANQYLQNLKNIMALLRAALRAPDLPVVVGKITDSHNDPEDGLRMNWGHIVQQAQRVFEQEDVCADLVTVTETFKHLDDGWHYNSADYITLGKAFAESIRKLEKGCGTAQ